MSVKKKRTIGPCRGVTWLYYVVLLWSRDFFPPLYLDPRFRPLLLKYTVFQRSIVSTRKEVLLVDDHFEASNSHFAVVLVQY